MTSKYTPEQRAQILAKARQQIAEVKAGIYSQPTESAPQPSPEPEPMPEVVYKTFERPAPQAADDPWHGWNVWADRKVAAAIEQMREEVRAGDLLVTKELSAALLQTLTAIGDALDQRLKNIEAVVNAMPPRKGETLDLPDWRRVN
jgi:hypothetical protein